MRKYIIILSVIIITMASCQKNATNVKLPPAKIQLVVQSYISPQDSLIKVYVTESTPVFGQKQQNNWGIINSLPDAKVEITHNSVVYTLLYDGNELAFTIDSSHLKIIAGEIYSIKVSRGSETVTGNCTVPFPPFSNLSLAKKIELKAELDPHTKDTLNIFYQLRTYFDDRQSLGDYYRVYISSNSQIWEYLYNTQGNITDSVLSSRQNFAFFEKAEQEYVTDVDINGQRIFQNSTIYLSDKRTGNVVSTEITLGIMHADVNYYKYHTSAIGHLNNKGNPFAEPSLVFTNIQGGLGIFAAYNYRYWVKKL